MSDAAEQYIYCLRTTAADGSSSHGFVWPAEVGAEVVAPDWRDDDKCGGGLHGLARGEGDGALLDWSSDARWYVLRVLAAEFRDLDGKGKFPRCWIEYVGDRCGATQMIARLHPEARAIVGGTATAGYRGTATAGYCGTLVLCWWDSDRYRLSVGYVGEDGIEAGVRYRLDDAGKFVRAEG